MRQKLALLLAVGGTLISSIVCTAYVSAIDVNSNCNSIGVACETVREDRLNLNNRNTVSTAVNWALWLLAGIAVIMIIVGSLQLVFSQGDPKKAADARMTITYAVVGLAVAMLATVIVQYVTDNLL